MASEDEGVTVNPVTFGPMHVDWETRIDYDKMRRERLQRTRDAMEKFGLDYLILLRYENGRYVTSVKRLYWPTVRFGGGPIIVLPREGLPGIWIIDTPFQSKALSWFPRERFRESFSMDEAHEVESFCGEVLDMFGSDIEHGKVGVDLWSPAMNKVLYKRFPKVEFTDGQEVMLNARMIKTAEEISCMKMSSAITEAGVQAAVDILKPGVKECELVGACFNKFFQLGSETTQCSQVVNSGPGTLPYRRFYTDRIIQAGELVNMDFGACFNGYFGDMTRAFVCGKKPNGEQLDLFKKTHEQQMELFRALRPGVESSELCEKYGRRQIGHSIGLAGQEHPNIHIKKKFVLQAGMVFSIGTMVKGTPRLGSAHLEDQVVITEKGCELNSTFPYTGVDDN